MAGFLVSPRQLVETMLQLFSYFSDKLSIFLLYINFTNKSTKHWFYYTCSKTHLTENVFLLTPDQLETTVTFSD